MKRAWQREKNAAGVTIIWIPTWALVFAAFFYVACAGLTLLMFL
jgi:hypothetical protein